MAGLRSVADRQWPGALASHLDRVATAPEEKNTDLGTARNCHSHQTPPGLYGGGIGSSRRRSPDKIFRQACVGLEPAKGSHKPTLRL
jgi:hypothetical protein